MEQLGDVQIVWFEEWYDGPLTGVAEHSGQRFWFTPLADDWYKDRPRRFALRRLAEPEAASLDLRIEDSRSMSPEDYWQRYHSEDSDDAGSQVHDGEVVGWFLDTWVPPASL